MNYAGVSLMILYAFIMKFNCAAQNALYGGATLQPLTVEGFVTPKISAINKDNLPLRASLVNEIFTLLVIIVYLIIPDLIKGIEKSEDSSFDVGSLTSATSMFCVTTYMLVLFACLKNSKDFKTKFIFKLAFAFAFTFLAFTFIYH
jgi:uncharacterized membrane protein